MIGRAREACGGQDPEPPLILMETDLVELGDLLGGLPLGESRRDDLVLASIDRVLAHVADVGDVLYRDDRVAKMLERPADPVREQVGTQIPEVGRPVDGRAAGVHAHLAGPLGGERQNAPLKGVVDAELHGFPFDEGRPVSAEA